MFYICISTDDYVDEDIVSVAFVAVAFVAVAVAIAVAVVEDVPVEAVGCKIYVAQNNMTSFIIKVTQCILQFII